MRLRPILLILLLLLVAGCGGSQSSVDSNDKVGAPDPAAAGIAGRVALELSAARDGGNYRLNLHARNAVDLYQIAGTLNFDSGTCRVLAIEAGGGLGDPQNAYFTGMETTAGSIAFAYTKKAYGQGVNGDAWLLSVIVEPLSGKLSLRDFSLVEGEGSLLARDSHKKALAVSVSRGGVK